MLEFQKKLTNSFYALLSFPATAMGFALSIQIAALTWIMNTQYQLDIHEVGFVWAAGPLAGILGQPIVGLISDKVWFWGGRRRPFILLGGTLAALMLIALPHIDAIDSTLGIGSLIFVALFVALTLDMAINISFNPTRSIIADVTPEGVPRTRGYTWMQTISGTFGVLAYFIGAVFGNYFLIYSGAILVLLFSVVPMFFIEEPKELNKEETEESSISEEKSDVLQFIKLCIAHGFSWLGIQTMFVYIIFFIKQKLFGIDDLSSDLPEDINNQIGQIISISFLVLNAVGAILPATVLEPLAKKIGRVKTHLSTIFIMAAGYFGIVFFASSDISLYIFMAVCGTGWAAVVSLPFAIMSEKVNKSKMGFFMGMFNLSVVIPQLIASVIIGSVISSFTDQNIIFIISGTSLFISGVLWFMVKENKKV